MRQERDSSRNPSMMPVDAACDLPSVQLSDETVIQLTGIIRVEIQAAAFVAAHGAIHDQGGHGYQVAQFQNIRRNAVPPVEILHLPVQHAQARCGAVQPFVGPYDGDIIPHQAADFIPIVVNDGKFIRQGRISVVPRGNAVARRGVFPQGLLGQHGVQGALGHHHAFQQGIGG